MLNRKLCARIVIIAHLLVVGLALNAVNALQDVVIEKSTHDNRLYKGIYLDNGLRVLLVSDPDAEKAAAAMNVEVGSFNEPADREGLAHFLEHMLFLGTDKYPNSNEFSTYISAHGGFNNAWTAARNTQYYFDVLPEHLSGALDRFAQFFIAPQFNTDLVDRERNAVDSEYKLSIQRDGWRINEVNGITANPEHPIRQFSVGSLETLGDKPNSQMVRDALVKFYADYYTAERMALVIVAPQTLEDQEQIVLQYFSAVPKHKVSDNKISAFAYTGAETGQQISIQTLGDYQELDLVFPIPSQREKFNSKSLQYVLYMLEQTGAGSLYQTLKSKNLIASITANFDDLTTNQDLASIGFSLTPDGMQNIDQIVNATFSYLDYLNHAGPQESIFAELRLAGDRNFIYAEKYQPVDFVSSLAQQMHLYPIGQVLTASYFTKNTKFNADEITGLFKYFTPDNMRLLILNKNVKGDKNEPHFNVNYSVSKFSEQQLKAWATVDKSLVFSMPKPNIFMPENLAVLSDSEEVNVTEYPQLILNSPGVALWYKHDQMFSLPIQNNMFVLAAPNMQNTAKRAMLQKFMLYAYVDRLSNLSSQFGLAGVSYTADGTAQGLELGVSMYSDKQTQVMHELISYLLDYKIDPLRFTAYTDQLKRDLLNFKQLPPYAQAAQILSSIIQDPAWLPTDLLAEIDKIDQKQVEDYTVEFLKNVQLKSLVHGNVTSTEATELLQQIAKQIKVNTTDPAQSVLPKLLQISDGSKKYYQFNPEHPDGTIVTYFQAPVQSDKIIATNALLIDMMSTKVFDQLRTKEQLGYVVQLGVLRKRDQAGIVFYIESATKKPEYLYSRLTDYLTNYKEILPKTNSEELATYRSSLTANLLRKPTSLSEESARYWSKIVDGSLRFDFNEAIAQQVTNVSVQDLADYYSSIWFDSKTARQIMVCSKDAKTALPGGKPIKAISDFRKSAQYSY